MAEDQTKLDGASTSSMESSPANNSSNGPLDSAAAAAVATPATTEEPPAERLSVNENSLAVELVTIDPRVPTDGSEINPEDAGPPTSESLSPPGREDTESMIGDPHTARPGRRPRSKRLARPLPNRLQRWTVEDANPYHWPDVRGVVFCDGILMLIYAVFFGLANQQVPPFDAAALLALVGVTVLLLVRMFLGAYTKFAIAKSMKSAREENPTVAGVSAAAPLPAGAGSSATLSTTSNSARHAGVGGGGTPRRPAD